ncbi:hypothetical protein QC820_16665 [Halomonas mongoliensis]|uniref:Uncharacterized protein n=1 Tax=Halomonas mongoliensis TaxID=321265 RepID=A0ABU1GQX7_9GAMM|nr:hypothetical protein [Halomonas mongoliensis]MDR5894421.1 hypothetical protein [Halomonas mongoliensis]
MIRLTLIAILLVLSPLAQAERVFEGEKVVNRTGFLGDSLV